jgi:hypothetical protein
VKGNEKYKARNGDFGEEREPKLAAMGKFGNEP